MIDNATLRGMAAHDREDLRRTHAHARLGFDDAQIEAMLGRQGFVAESGATVDGGELAVKVWTGRRIAPAVPQIGRKSAGTRSPSAMTPSIRALRP